MTYAYIACAAQVSEGGGIFRCSAEKDGTLKLLDRADINMPLYLEVHEHKMYAVTRMDGMGQMRVCDILSDGSLGEFSAPLSTGGADGCHITVSENGVYCANYEGGSLCRFSRINDEYRMTGFVQHIGHSINRERQEKPHVHHVTFTPDGKYLCATDLGCDKISLYTSSLERVKDVFLPAGYGPRHLIFTPNRKYAFTTNELDVSVTAFAYENGIFSILGTYDLLPDNYSASDRALNTAAAVRISANGKYLYASTRYNNSITVFAINEGTLKRLQIIPCGGDWCRDINITPDEKYLYCANERGNSVTAFSCGRGGKLTMTNFALSLTAPLNVVFAEI